MLCEKPKKLNKIKAYIIHTINHCMFCKTVNKLRSSIRAALHLLNLRSWATASLNALYPSLQVALALNASPHDLCFVAL